jgi:hypothetical protein
MLRPLGGWVETELDWADEADMQRAKGAEFLLAVPD